MKKPLIGIVAKKIESQDCWHHMDIIDDLRYVLIKHGALVLGILPTNQTLTFLDEEDGSTKFNKEELSDLKELLSPFDGVILQGGANSADYEVMIARYCIKNDIPLLGIGAGFNTMVKAMKGTVQSDESGLHNQDDQKTVHEVKIRKESLLYDIMQAAKIPVNSIHQNVCKKEDIQGYQITAVYPIDATVEGIELSDKKFVLGVKWQPELMGEAMDGLFDRFVRACQKEENEVE